MASFLSADHAHGGLGVTRGGQTGGTGERVSWSGPCGGRPQWRTGRLPGSPLARPKDLPRRQGRRWWDGVRLFWLLDMAHTWLKKSLFLITLKITYFCKPRNICTLFTQPFQVQSHHKQTTTFYVPDPWWSWICKRKHFYLSMFFTNKFNG